MLRAAAEREATNAPLQGSAADLMKLAMVRIDRALEEARLDATMLLQIHDELIFEVRKSELQRGRRISCASHMENAIALSVPLEVTLKSGRNWYDVEPIDVDEPRACIDFVAILVAASCRPSSCTRRDADLTLEVARTEPQREHGLMDRTTIRAAYRHDLRLRARRAGRVLDEGYAAFRST